MVSTIDYYNQNADAFIDDTLHVDMTPLHQKFTTLLPKRGLILDAGCGSGRDSAYFKQAGFNVYAFDASEQLAARAAILIEQTVEVTTFQRFQSELEFDGIWACASLLHVAKSELLLAIGNLSSVLKLDGVMYVSFKYGSDERIHHGRRFTDLDEPGLAKLVESLPNLVIEKTWLTGDQRPGRENEQWLNAILRKQGERK